MKTNVDYDLEVNKAIRSLKNAIERKLKHEAKYGKPVILIYPSPGPYAGIKFKGKKLPAKPVVKTEGRWYIRDGFAGCGSRINSGNGYATISEAVAAIFMQQNSLTPDWI